MNKRKALEAVLADEEAQEQAAGSLQALASQLTRQDQRSGKDLLPEAKGTVLPDNDDEFDWYEQ